MILNQDRPTAYLVPAETYEWMMEQLEDQELAQIAKDRAQNIDKAVKINLDDL